MNIEQSIRERYKQWRLVSFQLGGAELKIEVYWSISSTCIKARHLREMGA